MEILKGNPTLCRFKWRRSPTNCRKRDTIVRVNSAMVTQGAALRGFLHLATKATQQPRR